MGREVIVSGVGGQGLQVVGQLLAYGGTIEGRHVLYYPLYDGLQRGGASDCLVAISDEDRLPAPVLLQPVQDLIIMHGTRLRMFLEWVKPGGVIVYNTSVQGKAAQEGQLPELGRGDLALLPLPATSMAYEKLGNVLMACMVATGAYIAASGIIKMETAQAALAKALRPALHKHIPKNLEALELGAAFAQKYLALGAS